MTVATMTLVEANNLIEEKFTISNHIFDSIKFGEYVWEDHLAQYEKAIEIANQVAIVEDSLGIGALLLEKFNLEQYYSWLNKDTANMLTTYNMEVSSDIERTLEDKKTEILERINEIDDEIEKLRITYSVELYL